MNYIFGFKLEIYPLVQLFKFKAFMFMQSIVANIFYPHSIKKLFLMQFFVILILSLILFIVLTKIKKRKNTLNSASDLTNLKGECCRRIIKKVMMICCSLTLIFAFIVDFLIGNNTNNLLLKSIMIIQKFTYWPVVFFIIFCIFLLFVSNKNLERHKKHKKLFDKKKIIYLGIVILLSSVRFFSLNSMLFNPHETSMFFSAEYIKLGNACRNFFDGVCYGTLEINDSQAMGTSFFSYFALIGLYIFEDDVLALKIISAIFGFLTVILTFFLVTRLYNPTTGFVSAVLFAFLPWHYLQSLIGLGEILVPLFSLLLLYTIQETLNKKDEKYFFLTSVLCGISFFYIYPSAKVLFWVVLVIAIFNYKKILRYPSKDVLIAFLVLALLAYPPIVYSLSKENCITGAIERRIQEKFSLSDYVQNFEEVMVLLFKEAPFGDEVFGNNFRHQLLVKPLNIILLFSLLYFSFLRNKNHVTLIWVVIPLLLVPFSISYSSRYLLAIIPAFLILIALFLEDIKNYFHKRIENKICKKLILVILIIVITLAVINQLIILKEYFINLERDSTKNEPSGAVSIAEYAASFLFENAIKSDKFVIFIPPLPPIESPIAKPIRSFYDYANYFNFKKTGQMSENIVQIITSVEEQKIKEESYLHKGYEVYYVLIACLDDEKNICPTNVFRILHPEHKPIYSIANPLPGSLEIYKLKNEYYF